MGTIYKIINEETGKFYIGGTLDYKTRKRVHLCRLKKGIHHCPLLQADFNFYGEGKFLFIVLEDHLIKSKLLNREQYYTDLLKPYYNRIKIVGRNKAHPITPKKEIHSKKYKTWTKQQRKAQSDKIKAYYGNISDEEKARRNQHKVGKVFSEETKKKLSVLKTGRQISEETKLKISNAVKQHYIKQKNKPI